MVNITNTNITETSTNKENALPDRTQEEYIAFIAREIEKAFDEILREQALQSEAILTKWNQSLNEKTKETERQSKNEQNNTRQQIVNDISFLQKIINKLRKIL